MMESSKANPFRLTFVVSNPLSLSTVLENHIAIHNVEDEQPITPGQQNAFNVFSYIPVKQITKQQETKHINKAKSKGVGDTIPKATVYYGQDYGSDYVKTKYIIHKVLKEDGPKLSAKQRAYLVEERCQTFLKENNLNLNYRTKCRFDHTFLTSRLYNLTVCLNAKVATTNTKRLLVALDHDLTDGIKVIKRFKEYVRKSMKYFQQLTSEKRNINVMFVREPLERLVSAYRDKRGYGTHLNDPLFSFTKYLKMILDEKLNNINTHNYPYFERCRPCEMKFDFICLVNHFNDDIKVVLRKIGASGKVYIPKRNETGYNVTSSDKLLKWYFRNVPNDIIHKLWEKYYKDYYIFGFSYPAHLMN